MWSWVMMIKAGDTSTVIFFGVLIQIRKKFVFGNHTSLTLLPAE